MMKLWKYWMRYWAPGLLAVGLLFIQVNADLALPDYMSRIVNVGIQQEGIDSVLPKAIAQTDYQRLEFFLTDGNKILLGRLYTQDDSARTPGIIKKFPLVQSQNTFVLKKEAVLPETLKLELACALAFSNALETMSKDPTKATAMGLPEQFAKIPAGTDMFELMVKMPPEQLQPMKDKAFGFFSEMDLKMVEQMAFPAVKNYYVKLGMDIGQAQIGYIINAGLLMLLITGISAICTIFVSLIASRVAAATAARIRGDVFRKVESFSAAEFDRFSTASLITRSTNDITQVQTVIFMFIRMVIFAPIMGIGGILRAMGKAPSMGWIIGLAVLVLLGIITIAILIVMPKFIKIQKFVDKLNLVARENLSGLLVVRAFNRQKFEEKRFDDANQDLTKTNLAVTQAMVFIMPFVFLIMNVLTVAILWIGSHQVGAGSMQVGDMMAFLQYAMMIVMSFMMLSMVMIFLPRAAVSGGRIAEVLRSVSSVNDPKQAQILPTMIKGEIEFRNVNFRYPGGEVDAIENISFKAEPGKTTAIIGSTGSGKSTIVNLIPRFYDVTKGEILIDGVDIRNVTQHDLRSRIGFVPQKNTLFTGTVASNLKYGDKNATADDLNKAVTTAQVQDFIEEREGKFEAEISQAGTNVSGGQKQRLAIARALLKKAPIIIFDDSFSALDFKTDSALRNAMKHDTAGSTVLIVAQRIATIMNADRILVLENGKIVGDGTHAELMDICLPYREIAQSQLGLKEVV